MICGLAIFPPLGVVLPELFGIGSILMGGTLLGFSLHILKESAKRKIDKLILEELINEFQSNSKS